MSAEQRERKKLIYHTDMEKLAERVKTAEGAAKRAEALVEEIGSVEELVSQATEAAADAERIVEALTREGDDWKALFVTLYRAVRDHEARKFPRGRPMVRSPSDDPDERLYDALDQVMHPINTELIGELDMRELSHHRP